MSLKETLTEILTPEVAVQFFESWVNEGTRKTFQDTTTIMFRDVDSYGGEGMGDEYWTVYEFADMSTGEKLSIMFDGYYASYSGSTFNEWYVVAPKEVVKIEWTKV